MSEQSDLELSKELNKDVLDSWQVPETKEPVEVEFDTDAGCIYHEPVDEEQRLAMGSSRVPEFANIPGVCYEILS